MCTLARRTSILAEAERQTGIHLVATQPHEVLGSLAHGVIRALRFHPFPDHVLLPPSGKHGFSGASYTAPCTVRGRGLTPGVFPSRARCRSVVTTRIRRSR